MDYNSQILSSITHANSIHKILFVIRESLKRSDNNVEGLPFQCTHEVTGGVHVFTVTRMVYGEKITRIFSISEHTFKSLLDYTYDIETDSLDLTRQAIIYAAVLRGDEEFDKSKLDDLYNMYRAQLL